MDNFEEDSYERESIPLEGDMKDALKTFGKNKTPGIGGISIELSQATETECIKILVRICQQWKTKQWPTDRKEAFSIHPNL